MKIDEIIDQIVSWLKDYCENAKMTGFVVGVSGGIDSAVTSTLCAKTGKSVILLSMPIYQERNQLSLADQHIKWLKKKYDNVTGIMIDITSAFDAVRNVLPSDIQDELTMANTRSRMRMLTLYAFASHNRMIVTGTGNKVEDFGVGFYTKYGDGGVDISPIADLMKSEVYKIAGKLRIIEEIIKAQPTDGLWTDGRTDESQIGATYSELEWAMEFDAKPDKWGKNLTGRQKEVLLIYRKFHMANKHKMEPVPVFKIPDKD